MGQLLRGQDDISSQVPMPTDRVDDSSVSNDVAAETLTWLYVTGGAYASATGQAAGTVVTGKLTYSGVLNSMKTTTGSTQDTSFALGAATRFDTLVTIPEEELSRLQFLSPTAQIAAISPFLTTNGHYFVDHRRGQVWGKSLDTVADDAADYSYATPITGGGAGDKVDLIKVGGTAVNVGGGNRDAGTQTVTLADDDPATVSLALIDDAVFADEAAYALGTNKGLAIFGQYTAAGDNVADGQTGVFAMTIDRHLHVQTDGYDTGTDSIKGFEVSPISTHHIEASTTLTNVENATPQHVYLDMDGYRNWGAQWAKSGGADTYALTIEATIQDDGTAAASCSYIDVTADWFGVASWTASGLIQADETISAKYVRLKFTTAGAGNDADFVIYTKKLY